MDSTVSARDSRATLAMLRKRILKHEEEKALELIDCTDHTVLSTVDDTGGSLLQLAAAAHTEGSEVLYRLMARCPDLLLVQRKGRFNGQTPFHTLVSKGDLKAVKDVFNNHLFRDRIWELLNICADGESFEGTVMMGQLPFTIAALTLNKKMVDALLDLDRDFKLLPSTNKKGDTVFHSLIRYSHLYPEEEQNIENMMRYLHHHFRVKCKEEPPRSLWRIDNHDGFTPLTLAAELTQPRLFDFILKLEGVYSELNGQDGLFDYLNYDITEIDPAAARDVKNRADTEQREERRKHRVTENATQTGGSTGTNDYTDTSGTEVTRTRDTSRAAGTKNTRNNDRTGDSRSHETLGVSDSTVRATRTNHTRIHHDTSRTTRTNDTRTHDTSRATRTNDSTSATTTYDSAYAAWASDNNAASTAYSTSRAHDTAKAVSASSHCNPRSKTAPSQTVLEIVCGSSRVDRAFRILDNHVVRQVVKEKWEKYRWWFYGWGVLHVFIMVSLTLYTVFKAQVIIFHRNASTSLGDYVTGGQVTDVSRLHEHVVLTVSVLFFLLSLLLFAWEALRIARRHPFHIHLPHHNGLFRIQLIVFATGLIGDAVWYWIADDYYGNYFLLVALLVGWWFTTFFLRPFKKFSFFTVMIHKVFFGDLLRFSIVILLVYLSFSVAMYIVYLPAPTPEFRGLDNTLLTMFELMLGQTDVKVLREAPQPWLAVVLFVMYMLFTFILILNALIALMSNTCSAVSSAKESHREMQRLAVVLFIEASLPRQRCLHIVGSNCKWQRKMFDTGQLTKEYGYAEQIASLHSVRKDAERESSHRAVLDTTDGRRHSNDWLDGEGWEHGSSADELLYCLRFQLPTNAH